MCMYTPGRTGNSMATLGKRDPGFQVCGAPLGAPSRAVTAHCRSGLAAAAVTELAAAVTEL